MACFSGLLKNPDAFGIRMPKNVCLTTSNDIKTQNGEYTCPLLLETVGGKRFNRKFYKCSKRKKYKRSTRKIYKCSKRKTKK